MKIVLFANSRSGSTYFVNGLEQCLREKFKKEDIAKELTPTPFSTFHQHEHWVLRLFPRHVHSMIELIETFLTDDIVRVFLFRNDLEDQTLSKIIMTITGVANIKEDEHPISDLIYKPEEHGPIIENRIQDMLWYKNMVYDQFRMDHVIDYNNFQGPGEDFKFLFPDIDLKNRLLEKKMHTKQQKITAFVNYDEFKQDFDDRLRRFGIESEFLKNTKPGRFIL